VLAFAYFVSVAYYLNLFGAFGVSLTQVDDAFHAKLLTSAVLVLIVSVGWTRGFSAMERMEQFSVSTKLSIIIGLLLGLAFYFQKAYEGDTLVLNTPTLTGWSAITLGFGLIVTVQGFETSRYLGSTYDAGMRIRSMRLAQLIASGIYILYIVLLAYLFESSSLALSETMIIDMMAVVAPVLPLLLVAAALSAQFRAAVADTGGAGGLVSELTGSRIDARQTYAIVAVAGLLMTWTINLFEIIAYASRAFALYYALQALIAAVDETGGRKSFFRFSFFAGLAVLGLVMTLFGESIE
jgi:hypothetical protein